MPEKPRILHLDRTKFLLEGAVQSRSEKDRTYQPRIILSANFLCPCDGNQMRDVICIHLRTILEAVDKDELVAFILDAQQIPDPITPTERT